MATTATKNSKTKEEKEELKELLTDAQYLQIPKIGDVVKGKIISASRRAVYLDIDGTASGIVRGRELFSESQEYSDLQPDDEVEATVLEMENENGEMELSFRYAGHRKAWDHLKKLQQSGEVVVARVYDANKGGLMINISGINGFLPVSQLMSENYPRVQGGDRNKILEKLKEFIGQEIKVTVLDTLEKEEKLIVSEKAAWEEKQNAMISKYKIGDMVEGEVTAVTGFGAFIKFDNLEGLIHISELAWQRIDDPRDIVKVGEKIKAEIINVDGSKIFLSTKKLKKDPWQDVDKKYKVGEIVEGKILKTNPFGLFVELDKNIHGLAHISELSDKPITDIEAIAKAGDVKKFKIISIEPKNHRLGLSLKFTEKQTPKTAKKTSASAKDSAADTNQAKNKKGEEQDIKKDIKTTEEKREKNKKS